jgi:hypothetical protein
MRAEPVVSLDVPPCRGVGWARTGASRIERGHRHPSGAREERPRRPGAWGRINFFGFLLRLIARLPFLFIAGRMYGPEALGRFAYAVLVVEFVAQLATLGLKRGLAEQLSKTDKPHVCVVWDALLLALLASVVGMALLFLFPQAMFPNSEIFGLEWLLPVAVLALAWSEVMLAALAYRHDVGATVRARAIVEPWVLSLAALGMAFVSKRDGLIFAYALSMIAALVASAIPFFRTYGRAAGWRPNPAKAGRWRGATCRWRRPTRWNGPAAASTLRSSACSQAPHWLESITSRRTSLRCRAN